MESIGRSITRIEGHQKVTGEAQFVDDLSFPDMLYGAVVRSKVPCGKIEKIEFGPGIKWDEFVVVKACDIPGDNVVWGSYLHQKDQPYLAGDKINHVAEPIVLLAHPDRDYLAQAMDCVGIVVRELPAVLSWRESLRGEIKVGGVDNVFKSYRIQKGDIEEGFKASDVVVEGEYETYAQEQLYIETNGVIAHYNQASGLMVYGSMQCPYYIHGPMASLLGVAPEKVKIIQMETGGGFGGKEEYPTLIAGYAALLAYKSQRHVKMIYSRAEDMLATTKRHPSRSFIKSGHLKDGSLCAIEFDFVLDGGAYCTLSPVVLSRGTIHAIGPYLCDNVVVNAKVVATHYPPFGAFRGFGAPQSIFAMERHWDRVAVKLNIDSDKIRRTNFIKQGQQTATKQKINEDPGLDDLLSLAQKKSSYHRKRAQFEKHNQSAEGLKVKKGIGLATFMHGAGFTGAGEKYLKSVVGLEANERGEVTVLSSSTEIGQGSNTIFTQVVADVLKIPLAKIKVQRPDTSQVPDSGPTVASRTAMIVGDLVKGAALKLLERLGLGGPYSFDQFQKACRMYLDKESELKIFYQYDQPKNVVWDPEKYEGDAYGTYAWAAYIAEVSVDMVDYSVKVDHFTALQEVGKVLNPVLAAGQIEGGVAQALGFALCEKVVWDKGQMINNQMTNYIMMTAADIPPIDVHFVEKNRVMGPSGGKGIGELPMDGPGPAVINAVAWATGWDIKKIPCLPEDLFELGGGSGPN